MCKSKQPENVANEMDLIVVILHTVFVVLINITVRIFKKYHILSLQSHRKFTN